MEETIQQFIATLTQSLKKGTFVKLTLSNYKGPDRSLQKILVRPVETKSGGRLMFQFRGPTSDQVKNFDQGSATTEIQSFLEHGFRNAHVFTTENDLQLTIGKRSAKIKTGKPTFTATAGKSHDREKNYLIDPNAYYLKALGITTERQKPESKGRVASQRKPAQSKGIQHEDIMIRSDQRDKWKQINKFVEILASLYLNSDLKDKPNLKIVDMGSGKGYLTFAAYDYFSSALEPGRDASVNERGDAAVDNSSGGRPIVTLPDGCVSTRTVTVTGVESRQHLVDLCNQIAQTGGYDGLKFIQGNIADFDPGQVDILIALHACDTATDDALFKGITSNASVIVAAPCCHHEVIKQLKSPDLLAGILKHPVLLERTAETVTDGLRSMLLEREGYKTKMFEFVSTEHTPKNNMLVASKRPNQADQNRIDQQIEGIQNTFGIEQQHLVDALKRRK